MGSRYDSLPSGSLRSMGTNLPAGTTFLGNPNQIAQGRIGFLVALPAGQVFTAGEWKPLVLEFEILPGVTVSRIAFGDVPVFKEIVSPEAEVLAASFRPVDIAASPMRPELGPLEVYAGFEVRGIPGRRYRIERGAPGVPLEWVPAGELVLEGDAQTWIDVGRSARDPGVLYRVVEVP